MWGNSVYKLTIKLLYSTVVLKKSTVILRTCFPILDFGSSPRSPGDFFDMEDEEDEKSNSSQSDDDDPSTVRSVSVTVHPSQGSPVLKRPRSERANLSLALWRPTGGCGSSSPLLSRPFSPARQAVQTWLSNLCIPRLKYSLSCLEIEQYWYR